MADPPPPPTIPEAEEYYSSWSLFLICLLLILSLWTSYYLQIKRIRAVHETLVSIFAGMAVGLVIRIAPDSMVRDMLKFKHTFFFNLLLPPIILNSGYELKQENFFRNFGSILTFAFLGTLISAVGVGLITFVYQTLGLESLDLTLIECLLFGSTLSATDPVTILAIFQQYKVDPKLYTIIFGESLLNDAVSIVMYETLKKFQEFHVSSVFHSIGIFLLFFSVSMALGVFFGLSTSLLLKHSSLHLYPGIETCLVALSAYTCYFFSNVLTMSGIVSLLFCGITLKHYAYHTMSRRTQRASKYIFQTLAQISENFIFVYLGMSLFTSAPKSEKVTSYVKPLFIAISTVAVIFTRYAAVFPLSTLLNLFYKHARGQRTEELPHSYQMMLFWAGLRGAVGVALAAGFEGSNAETLRTTVLVVVLVSVILFGGTTARMLEVLGIRTGVEDEGGGGGESSDEEENASSRNVWLGGRRAGGEGGRRWAYEEEQSYLSNGGRNRAAAAARIGTHYAPRHYNHHHQQSHSQNQSLRQGQPLSAGIFSTSTSPSDSDSEGDVLPLATTHTHPPSNRDPSSNTNANSNTNTNPGTTLPPSSSLEDGKWFQALDERYLLPLFSNATASRTFHARRARRSSTLPNTGSRPGSVPGTPGDSGDEHTYDHDAFGGGGQELRGVSPLQVGVQNQQHQSNMDSRLERGLPSPTLRSSGSLSALNNGNRS